MKHTPKKDYEIKAEEFLENLSVRVWNLALDAALEKIEKELDVWDKREPMDEKNAIALFTNNLRSAIEGLKK